MLTLYPLAYGELSDRATVPADEAIFRGGYPRRVARDLDPGIFFDSYLRTYVERDVRDLAQVGDLGAFTRFVRLCAARTAQVLNFAGLARDADVAPSTAKAWYSILEASYLVFRLEPYHRNFNKRLTKSPKHYFTDTGLVAHLLGIESADALRDHYLYGSIAETYLVAERVKRYTNRGRRPPLTWWRDSNGHEIDLVEEVGGEVPLAWELKAAATGNTRYFDELAWWQRLTGAGRADCAVVYLGDEGLGYAAGELTSWRTWLGD